MSQPAFGLCDTCRHQRIVRNTRGSMFSLCERSRSDADFPRYPRVPVLECRGYERGAGDTGPGWAATPGDATRRRSRRADPRSGGHRS